MKQTRQFFGYLLVFLAASMLWQSWQKQQEEANKVAPAAISGSADTHVNTMANLTKVEVAPSARLVTIETDVQRIKIDKLGGRIVGVELRDYTQNKTSKTPVSFVGQDDTNYLTSQFGLTGDAAILFNTPQSNISLPKGQSSVSVTLEGTNAKGVSFKKSYTFFRGKYHFSVATELENTSTANYTGHPYSQLRQFVHDAPEVQGNFLDKLSHMTRFNTFTGVSYYSSKDNYVKLAYKDLDEKQVDKSVANGWLAIQKPYFLSAWIPQNQHIHHLYTDSKPSQDGKIYTVGMLGNQVVVTPGESLSTGALFYTGPEITANLKPLAKGLDLTIDYGWLWMLSNFLFWLLDLLHSYLHNWGLAIILVTVSVKAAFYKMSESSYISIAKMKKIQPRLEALKRMHGDDREKLGVATRELFLQEKVNPLGGCLPVLVQVPFFIALYYVLIESVQLRHAPFFGWIQDLSAPDPLMILPILMGASMLYQQTLNPKPEDPVQEKMMYLFPVFLTVVFLSFPSGLVLYWVTNNVLSILQQVYVSKKHGHRSK